MPQKWVGGPHCKSYLKCNFEMQFEMPFEMQIWSCVLNCNQEGKLEAQFKSVKDKLLLTSKEESWIPWQSTFSINKLLLKK